MSASGINIFELLSTGAAAVAAGFAGWQIYLSRVEHRKEFEWRQAERTFSYSIFKNPEYRVSRDYLKEVFGSLALMKRTVSNCEIDQKKATDDKLVFHIFVCISH